MTDREEAERIVTSSYILRHTLIDAVAAALSAARAEQREEDAKIIEDYRKDAPETVASIGLRFHLAAAILASAPDPNQKGGDASGNDATPADNQPRTDVAQPRSAELSGEAPVEPSEREIVTHYADVVETDGVPTETETPAERQAKIVKWLRSKADQPWNVDTPVLRELADAIERGEFNEGAEK